MRYIKVQYKLKHPGSNPTHAYGFDTQWTQKTQVVHGQAVEKGDLVDFAPVTVQADGKCIILGTKRNIATIERLIEAGQMILGPGESLKGVAEQKVAPAEIPWPKAPEMIVEEGEMVSTPKLSAKLETKPVRIKPAEAMTPDVE